MGSSREGSCSERRQLYSTFSAKKCSFVSPCSLHCCRIGFHFCRTTFRVIFYFSPRFSVSHPHFRVLHGQTRQDPADLHAQRWFLVIRQRSEILQQSAAPQQLRQLFLSAEQSDRAQQTSQLPPRAAVRVLRPALHVAPRLLHDRRPRLRLHQLQRARRPHRGQSLAIGAEPQKARQRAHAALFLLRSTPRSARTSASGCKQSCTTTRIHRCGCVDSAIDSTGCSSSPMICSSVAGTSSNRSRQYTPCVADGATALTSATSRATQRRRSEETPCSSSSHSCSSRSVAEFARCAAHAGASARCFTAEIDASCVRVPSNSYDHRVVRFAAPRQQPIDPRHRRFVRVRIRFGIRLFRSFSRGNRWVYGVEFGDFRGFGVGEAEGGVQLAVGGGGERSTRFPAL